MVISVNRIPYTLRKSVDVDVKSQVFFSEVPVNLTLGTISILLFSFSSMLIECQELKVQTRVLFQIATQPCQHSGSMFAKPMPSLSPRCTQCPGSGGEGSPQAVLTRVSSGGHEGIAAPPATAMTQV